MSRRHLRPVPAAVQEEIVGLIGPAPRRDLLVEYLHRIQDARGCIDTQRLAALKRFFRAFEELRVVLDPRSLR